MKVNWLVKTLSNLDYVMVIAIVDIPYLLINFSSLVIRFLSQLLVRNQAQGTQHPSLISICEQVTATLVMHCSV